MPGRRSLLALAAASAVALAACTGEADFDRGEAEDVARALRDAGLRTCTTVRDESPPPDAVAATTFEVDERCGAGDPRTLVRVVEWKDEAARDAAVARYESGGDGRRSPSAAGAAWTFGPFSIVVSGEKDDREAELVAEAMDALGAE